MSSKRSPAGTQPPLNWPDDPETVTAEDVDFEALAHVLANTCRRGGCTRLYHSVAAHAVIVSEEIAALDGLGEEDRRTLAKMEVDTCRIARLKIEGEKAVVLSAGTLDKPRCTWRGRPAAKQSRE